MMWQMSAAPSEQKTPLQIHSAMPHSRPDVNMDIHPNAAGHAVIAAVMASALAGEPPAETALPFTDVAEGDWFYDAVAYVYGQGIMTGTSDTAFSPNLTTTRGMIVSMLHRLDGGQPAERASFADVDPDAWYADSVSWAVENGIMVGYGDTFGPNDALTREQMAAVLMNFAAYKGMDVSTRRRSFAVHRCSRRLQLGQRSHAVGSGQRRDQRHDGRYPCATGREHPRANRSHACAHAAVLSSIASDKRQPPWGCLLLR